MTYDVDTHGTDRLLNGLLNPDPPFEFPGPEIWSFLELALS